jgi:hypothetical protein
LVKRGKRRAPQDPVLALLSLRELLDAFPERLPENPDETRTEVLRLADMLDGLRGLARARLRHLTATRNARARVLAYLKMFVGKVVDGRELQIVGGIQEVPRRIRELRVQFGYDISTGYSREDLRPNQYVLESPEPNDKEAKKWTTANRIRRTKWSVKSKWLELLKAYVTEPVTKEQLAYVAPNKDLRRARELRTEEGWRVVTRQSGRPDLPAGVYVLESQQQLPPHDRKIPDATYDAVLERDGQRCRHCGWSVDRRSTAGRKQFLEVHHIEHHVRGGQNNQDNLITLCNVDHDEVHRRKVDGSEFFTWLTTGIGKG